MLVIGIGRGSISLHDLKVEHILQRSSHYKEMAAIKGGENLKERSRLLTSEAVGDREDGVQYKQLPYGIWFIERVGLLSTLSPARRKKL